MSAHSEGIAVLPLSAAECTYVLANSRSPLALLLLPSTFFALADRRGRWSMLSTHIRSPSPLPRGMIPHTISWIDAFCPSSRVRQELFRASRILLDSPYSMLRSRHVLPSPPTSGQVHSLCISMINEWIRDKRRESEGISLRSCAKQFRQDQDQEGLLCLRLLFSHERSLYRSSYLLCERM